MFNYGKDDDVIVRCIHFDSTPTLIKIPPVHSTDYDVKTLLRSFSPALPIEKGEKKKKKEKNDFTRAMYTAREIKKIVDARRNVKFRSNWVKAKLAGYFQPLDSATGCQHVANGAWDEKLGRNSLGT